VIGIRPDKNGWLGTGNEACPTGWRIIERTRRCSPSQLGWPDMGIGTSWIKTVPPALRQWGNVA
jgi:hypothetical protein